MNCFCVLSDLYEKKFCRRFLSFDISFGRSVEAGDGIVFAAEAGELAVDGNEDGVLDGGLDQRKLFGKVFVGDLHSIRPSVRPCNEGFDPRCEMSFLTFDMNLL